MAGKNGYFQICVMEDGTYLHIIPPKPGGVKVSVKEVSNYLEKKDFYFDILDLDDAINEEKDNYFYLQSDHPMVMERETMIMEISRDAMEVKARFYAPFEGGELIYKEEILHDLQYRKVVYGIDEAAIDSFVVNRNYCEDIILARGKKYIESQDGKIDYIFNTDLSRRPTLNEDGSVDFHKLDNICKCEKGDLLAVMTPADPGENGINVWGEETMPRPPKRVAFKYNRNVSVSPDGLQLIAETNGHVVLRDGKVIVSNSYVIKNVDVASGDIYFDGNVEVTGNVAAGFQISATGDVEVKGVVEGANIKAGGMIIIRRGINGMHKGILEAEGNVISKYIENATVYAGGYVETDCIIHSSVSSGTHIIVQGKRGFITGGTVRAVDYVEAKTIGSDMGVNTVVEVGMDPRKRQRLGELKKDNVSSQKQLERLEPVIKAIGERVGRGERLSPDSMEQAKDLQELIKRLKDRIRVNNNDIFKIEAEFAETRNSSIRVTGQAYPGIKLVVSEAALILKSSYQYCRFVKDEFDKVVMKAL